MKSYQRHIQLTKLITEHHKKEIMSANKDVEIKVNPDVIPISLVRHVFQFENDIDLSDKTHEKTVKLISSITTSQGEKNYLIDLSSWTIEYLKTIINRSPSSISVTEKYSDESERTINLRFFLATAMSDIDIFLLKEENQIDDKNKLFSTKDIRSQLLATMNKMIALAEKLGVNDNESLLSPYGLYPKEYFTKSEQKIIENKNS